MDESEWIRNEIDSGRMKRSMQMLSSPTKKIDDFKPEDGWVILSLSG
jgi:hypothetical protein